MQTMRPRYYWVDVAKVLGIVLVYYAHILQKTYRLSTDDIFFQYKLIYAFHLPLFFFISGFFYKKTIQSRLTEIGVLFQKRIFPVLLFGGISLAIWPLYLYMKFGEVDYRFLFSEALGFLYGRPGYNAAIWFLVCLFAAEIWAGLLLPKITSVFQGMLLSSFFLYFGYSLTSIPEVETIFLIPKNFWYIHESFLAFGFFAMGYSTFPWIKRLVETNLLIRMALIALFGWLTVWSVNLNSPSEDYVVVMKASLHGNYYFFISAFSGTLMTILIASLIPKMTWVDYIGRNTLVLMGTNGLFLSFFNSHVIRWLDHYSSTILVTLDSLWISVLTIGLSIPMIQILSRWVPQLIGKPQTDGPILKSIPPPQFLFLRTYFSKLAQFMGSIKNDEKSKL